MKIIKFIISLFTFLMVNNIITAQPASHLIYQELYEVYNWVGPSFYFTGSFYKNDSYIERINEAYMYYIPTSNPNEDITWTATGGTILKSIDTIQGACRQVFVQWDTDAPQYALRARQYNGSSTAIIDETFNFQKAKTFEINAERTTLCANDIVVYSFNFSLPDNSYITNSFLPWQVRIILTGPGIPSTTIHTFSGYGKSVTNSGSFVPENYGIYGSLNDIGTYQLRAEIRKSYDAHKFCPDAFEILDIKKPAPKVEKSGVKITELIISKDITTNAITKESTFSINQFKYEGTTYTNQGVFPNSSFDFNIIYYGHNYPTIENDWYAPFINKTETTWTGLIRSTQSNNNNFFKENGSAIKYKNLEIILNENGTGDGCTAFPSFNIPQVIISGSKPDCSTGTLGKITVNSSDGETYKLFKCAFLSNGNININRNNPIVETTLSGSNQILSNALESGEYVVQVIDENESITVEKYIDLTIPSMQITKIDKYAPTCHQGNDGSIKVTGLTYNGSTSIPNRISFYLDGSLYNHTTGDSNNDNIDDYILITGTATKPILDNVNHNLYFKVGTTCQSETLANINIPEKAQNKISGQAGISPLCHNGSDGKIQINAINFEGTSYNDATEYNSSGNSLTFNVYQNKTDATPYKSVTPGDDFDLPYTIEGLESRTNWYVSYINNSVCASDTVAVTINNPVNADIYLALAPENPITHLTSCVVDNGAIKVVPSGGFKTADISYHITGNNFLDQTFTNPTFNTYNFPNLRAGTYQIVVTDFCSETATLSGIVVNPAPRPIIDIDDVFRTPSTCFNGLDGTFQINSFGYNSSVYNGSLVDGTENFSFTLTHGISEQTIAPVSLPYIVNNCTGGDNWTVQIEETKSGCLTANDLNFSILQPEMLIIDRDIIPAQCHDQGNIKLNAVVSGGVDPYTYKWKDLTNEIDLPDNSPSIEVWEGDYELKVVDANNCGFGKIVPDGSSFTKAFTAKRPQPLDIYVENAVDVDSTGKANGSVVLGTTFNESFVKYSADGVNFGNNPLFNGLDAGVHTFYIQNENLCTNSIDVTIGTAPPFSANIGSMKNISCKGLFDGKVTLMASGGILPYTFEISGNGIQRTQSQNVFEDLPAGEYNLKISYTGVNTYTIDLGTIGLTEPTEALSANITEYVNAVCGKETGQATVTVSGGTPGYRYLWNDSKNQTSQTASQLAAGTYQVLVTDTNECTTNTSIVLFDPAGPLLKQVGSTPAPCFYSSDGGSATLSVSGGTAPFDVYWPALDLHDSVAVDIAPGNYSASVTDATGCTFPLNNIEVTAPSQLYASGDFEDPTCYNDVNGKIMAEGNGGTPPYQFSWQNLDGAGNQSTVSGLAAGKYYLQLTDDHNCTSLDSFLLINPDPIEIVLPDSVFICAGQTETLDADNLGSFFQWTSNNGFSSDKQIVTLQEQGDYTVTVSNVQGCSNSKTLHLKYENRQFDAGFLLASEATMIDTIVLIEISWPVPDSLEWIITDDFSRLVDGDAYKELIPLETGEYTIGMKAYMAGCEDIVEKTITIVPGDGQKDLKETKTDLIQSAKLFPNPNTGNFEVEVNLAYEADVRADLFSVKGLRIIPTKYDSGKKDYILSFNLMRLEPGVYFVNISAENEMRKLKFVVN